eukprot:5023493-Prymnesium_polylepis.1
MGDSLPELVRRRLLLHASGRALSHPRLTLISARPRDFETMQRFTNQMAKELRIIKTPQHWVSGKRERSI